MQSSGSRAPGRRGGGWARKIRCLQAALQQTALQLLFQAGARGHVRVDAVAVAPGQHFDAEAFAQPGMLDGICDAVIGFLATRRSRSGPIAQTGRRRQAE